MTSRPGHRVGRFGRPVAPLRFLHCSQLKNSSSLRCIHSHLYRIVWLYTPQCEAVLSIILPTHPPLLLHLPLAIPPHHSFPRMLLHSLQDDALFLLLPKHASHADASTSAPKSSTKFMLPMSGIALQPIYLQG